MNTNDIVKRLDNRSVLLYAEGLYVESAMNAEAAETIRVLRDEVQRLESLAGVYEKAGYTRTNHPTPKRFKITRHIV